MLIYIFALFVSISIIIFAVIKAISTFNPKSAVIYYGDNPPYELLASFDISIVEPGHGNTNTTEFQKHKEKIFAYVSIGEVEKNRSYYSQIKKEWIIGENKLWQSKLLNLANKEYQDFLYHFLFFKLFKVFRI
jgi:endo-alpha-1,4-polygalactosaminidase (GH114 family)